MAPSNISLTSFHFCNKYIHLCELLLFIKEKQLHTKVFWYILISPNWPQKYWLPYWNWKTQYCQITTVHSCPINPRISTYRLTDSSLAAFQLNCAKNRNIAIKEKNCHGNTQILKNFSKLPQKIEVFFFFEKHHKSVVKTFFFIFSHLCYTSHIEL